MDEWVSHSGLRNVLAHLYTTIDLDRLHAAMTEDKSPPKVPFHTANVPQIREAIALLHDSREARRRVPADLNRRARRLAEALPPAPDGLSTGSRVRLRRAKDGRVAVTFAAIPFDELESFIDVLREHLLRG